jgi:late competence protein required for DNA uptake (superfamily II DNA/RNA helicase)
MSDTKLICDVCNKNEALGVASSPFGAISYAYCRECLNKPADPLMTFEYLFETIYPNEAAWVYKYFTFKDGKYISWQEFVSEKTKGV